MLFEELEMIEVFYFMI